MENLWQNKKLQKWTEEHVDDILDGSCELPSGESLTVPSAEVNCFYILLHAYHHVKSEGLGLRQLMDYYFVLRTSYENQNENLVALIEEFGMMKFARGVMWLLHEVFGMERECMICEPDEKEGWFLLNEVMTGGNFGHHDERSKKIGKGKMVSVMNEVQHALRIGRHYQIMIFWRLVWIVWHYVWKRTSGRYKFEN